MEALEPELQADVSVLRSSVQHLHSGMAVGTRLPSVVSSELHSSVLVLRWCNSTAELLRPDSLVVVGSGEVSLEEA